MTDTAAGPQTEQWLYAGVRRNRAGAARATWRDPWGQIKFFAPKGASRYAIGAAYDVSVTRDPDGNRITMHGTPVFVEAGAASAEEQAEWETAEKVAKIALSTASRERNAKKQSALDEALRPLLLLAHGYRNGDDQDALTAYVSRRLHNAWAFGIDELKGETDD